jgi:hypothetical protein
MWLGQPHPIKHALCSLLGLMGAAVAAGNPPASCTFKIQFKTLGSREHLIHYRLLFSSWQHFLLLTSVSWSLWTQYGLASPAWSPYVR